MAAARVVRLADGRRLGFAAFGDPHGFPVVNNHGGLIGRLDVRHADAVARRLGVWLVSPDRPGIGASDPRPGRRLLDWPHDVAALADRLGIDRFAVLGWSMGGPYAIACAWALPDRVTRAALIATCPPLDDPRTFAELNRMDTLLTRLARRAPVVERALFAAMGLLAGRAPRTWAALTARSLPAVDAAIVRADAIGFARAQADAFRTAAGMVTEFDVWARPWGFGLAEVGCPIDVWQGEHDTLVPVAWADELVAGLPHATRRAVAGAGHFLAPDQYEPVLAALLPTDR